MLRRAIAMLIVFCFLFTTVVQAAEVTEKALVPSYSDIADYWAAKDIEKWTGLGLVSGYPDGKFKPENYLKRAEFCAVINRVFGYVEKSSQQFEDIKPTKWYADTALRAKAAGYIEDGVKQFKPNEPITREEVCAAVFKVFKLSKANTSECLKKYSDLSDYKGKYPDEIASVLSNGLLTGYKDSTFRPFAKITRAEFTKVLNSSICELFSKAGSYSSKQIKGNVIVNTPDVTLKDIKIEGNLYLTEGIGAGTVALENVTVEGQTYINGGGKNSIYIKNSSLGNVNIKKADGKIRLVISQSTIASITAGSGVILQTEGISNKLQGLIIDSSTMAGQIIDISGNFDSIVCNASGVILNINKGFVVNSLTVSANATGASITVAGSVASALINATGTLVNGKLVQQGYRGTISSSATESSGGGTSAGTGGNGSNGGNGGNGGSPPTPADPWTMVWNDEFNGTSVDLNKWRLEDSGGGFGNSEKQYYRPDNASVEDGKLIITAKKEAHGGEQYTSSKLFSKADWKYGKFEAKIKLPVGQGLWPAFWMMPAHDTYGGWAASGEMDIMEARGRLPGEVSGTLHYGGSWPSNKYTGNTYYFNQGKSIDQYHTYSIEWEPGEIRWYVDGQLYQTQNSWNTKGTIGEEKYSFPAPFDQNFYLMLNLAVGGNFDGGKLPDDSQLPARMEVDYVRVYRLSGRPYKTVSDTQSDAEPLPAGARQPDSTGNLVKDVNFENGINENAEGVDQQFGDVWNFVYNAQFGGVATATVDQIGEGSFARVNVTNVGSQPYSVQLEQHTTLGKGRWYKYSFDAKADKNRTLNTKFGGGPAAGWAAYSDSYTESLTTDFKHFEHTFQMSSNSDILTRIEYNCATDTGTVWIGNVRVEEIAPPAVDYTASRPPLPVSGNSVYNGTFDKYTVDRLAYWNVSKKNDASANISVPETTRELTAKITNGGSDADSVTLDQKGMQLTGKYGYCLSFTARADAARTIKVRVSDKDGTLQYLPDEVINLTTTMQEFTIPFTMGIEDDADAKLEFLMGGDNSDVYIDDVTLVSTTKDYSGVDLYPLKNGDFGLGLVKWEPFIQSPGAANFSTENGAARIDITNTGTEAWHVMLNQGGMSFKKGIEYEFSFDAAASVDRYINVSLENASYVRSFDSGLIELKSVLQHYSYTFKITGDETLALKYIVGNVSGAAIGTVFIDNVVLKVKDAPLKMSPMLQEDNIDNKAGNNVEIIFADDVTWRDKVTSVKINGSALTEGFTLEPGKLTLAGTNFATDDIYNISIEAEGYVPAVVAQQILPNDGNLILNGDFTKGNISSWEFWNNAPDWSSYKVENGAASIKINYHGARDNQWGVPFSWSTQFKQSNLKLEAGKTYELSFKAWCTEFERPIEVELTGFNNGEKTAFNLSGDQTKVYKKTFTAGTNVTVAVNYLLGYVENGGFVTSTGEHTVYIDDVAVREVATPPVLTADTTDNKLGRNINLTFTDNEAWRNALVAVKVDGVTLTTGYAVTAGNILIEAAIFAIPKDYTITIEALGYGIARISQSITTDAENIALGKVYSASSGNATFAFDSNMDTRWESNFTETEWVAVDLGGIYNLNSIIINWEAARSANYKLQIATVENPGENDWVDIYTIEGKTGDKDTIALSGQEARHVRMLGTKRALPYGHSIWEMEIYGTLKI